MIGTLIPLHEELFGAVALAWLLGLIALGSASFTLHETTLRAPLAWGWLAWCMFGAVLVPRGRESSYLEYTAAVLFISPVLAMLGAKRPQNGAWQFIVLTLVAVLLLPVLQGLAYGDSAPHVHALFRWLIAAHICL